MDILNEIWGHGDKLNCLQMSLRAASCFFIALILIRFTGMRAFGIRSAFDTCIIIMLGAVLSRAVVGASPFIPIVCASFILVLIHKIIGALSVKNHFISHLVKGKPLSLYKDGILNDKNMRRCTLSYGDIMEELRLSLNQNGLENVEEIFMERNGKISIIRKNQV